MELTPYVDSLRDDLAAAAAAGGPEARAVAERLALALEPAVRLALMEALSQAAAEITADLPAGSVDVRLRGREPQLVVDVPAGPPAPPQPPAPPAPLLEGDEDEDGGVARITLRLPESVKVRAEELATRGGSSLNTWLVTVVRDATRGRAQRELHDPSSLPLGDDGSPRRPGRRLGGWV